MKLTEQQKEEIKEIISDKYLNGETPNDTDRFEEDLGMVDLDLLELVVELEQVFDIAIPDEQWRATKTINDVFQIIDKTL
jgi:acyl carrier protein